MPSDAPVGPVSWALSAAVRSQSCQDDSIPPTFQGDFHGSHILRRLQDGRCREAWPFWWGRCLVESGSFMPPPGKGVHRGFVFASEVAACCPFQLHHVLCG